MGGGADRVELLLAVIEDCFELASNDERINDCAERTERWDVMNQIADFGLSVGERSKKVFVMPDPIGANALLVHEAVRRINRRNLRQPPNANPEQRSDGVFDHQARINRVRQ